MKRSWRQVFGEAIAFMWKDIKDYRGVWITIAIYFLVVWTLFDNSCIFVQMTGFPCPACGLTRAGVSVLRGDFHTAWQQHLFIYPVLALGAAAIVRRYFLKKSNIVFKNWIILIILGMVLYYFYRMWRYFPGDPPISYYGGNWLRKIFSLVRK